MLFAYFCHVSPSLDFMLKPEDFQASRNMLHVAPHANASIGTSDQSGMPHGLNPSPFEDLLVISTMLLYISNGGVQNFRIFPVRSLFSCWFMLVILLPIVGFFRHCQGQTNSLVFVTVDSEIMWNHVKSSCLVVILPSICHWNLHCWHIFVAENRLPGLRGEVPWRSMQVAEAVQAVERNRWGNTQLESTWDVWTCQFQGMESHCRTEIGWVIQFLLGWITWAIPTDIGV